jgi:hypothetical protein
VKLKAYNRDFLFHTIDTSRIIYIKNKSDVPNYNTLLVFAAPRWTLLRRAEWCSVRVRRMDIDREHCLLLQLPPPQDTREPLSSAQLPTVLFAVPHTGVMRDTVVYSV